MTPITETLEHPSQTHIYVVFVFRIFEFVFEIKTHKPSFGNLNFMASHAETENEFNPNKDVYEMYNITTSHADQKQFFSLIKTQAALIPL